MVRRDRSVTLRSRRATLAAAAAVTAREQLPYRVLQYYYRSGSSSRTDHHYPHSYYVFAEDAVPPCS